MPGSAIVPAGGDEKVSVPTSYDKLNVYKGSSGTTLETTPQEVKITNLSCTKASPAQVADNATKSNYEHRQMTSSTTGQLTVPTQPFGEFELCLAYNGTEHRTFTFTYKNETEAGPTLPIINVNAPSITNVTIKPSGSTVKC